MSSERFRLIESMFHRLVDLGELERRACLVELAREDSEAYDEVLRLLELDSDGDGQATADLVDRLEPGSAVEPLPDTGDRIGPFRLCRQLGEGGMGTVWEAEQEEPVSRTVALKLIKSGMDTKGVVARFGSERQALAMMDHPAIARVFEAGATAGGRPYFAMEYVPGSPIQRFCDDARLSVEGRLALFAEVCDAVHHAHQKGVLHRDLKPSNILVRMQDGQAAPKIIDFGIAKATAEPSSATTAVTEIGQLIGTPVYMSPEAATGLDLDVRSDVYSLGIVLHELMIGDLPIPVAELEALQSDEIRRRIREEEIPRPSRQLRLGSEVAAEVAALRSTDPSGLKRRLQDDIDWILLKALAKERERRYGSAAELAEDVRRHLRHEPLSAGPPSAGYRARKFVRRHRLAVTAAALVVFALLAGTVLAVVGLVGARRAEHLAQEAQATAESEAKAAREIADFLAGLFEASDPYEARGETLSARQLLDRGAERIGGELAEQPLLRARLLHTLGGIYTRLGLYSEAERQLAEAVELRRRELGDSSPALADSMVSLGTVLTNQLKLDQAKAQLREAVAVRERAFGPESTQVGQALNSLGKVHRHDFDYARARVLYRRALSIVERELGPEHEDTAVALANLGTVEIDLGEIDLGQERLERALRVAQRTLGPHHPYVGVLLNNLGVVHRRRGEYRRALEAYRKDLDLSRRILGERHRDIGLALRNLSYPERALGGYQAARRHLEESRSIFLETLGEDSVRVAETDVILGDLAVRVGDLEGAWALYDAALERFSRAEGGRDRKWRIQTLEERARVGRLLGRPGEAAATCRSALALVAELEQPPLYVGARCRLQLALLAVARGELAAADRLYAEAEQAIERDDGTDRLDDPAGAASRAAYWAARGDAERAFELLFKALESGRVEAWAPQNPDLAPLAADPRFGAFRSRVAARLAAR